VLIESRTRDERDMRIKKKKIYIYIYIHIHISIYTYTRDKNCSVKKKEERSRERIGAVPKKKSRQRRCLRQCVRTVAGTFDFSLVLHRSGLTPATSFLYAPLTMTHLSNAAEAHLPERRRTYPGARARRRLIPTWGCWVHGCASARVCVHAGATRRRPRRNNRAV